MLEQAKTELENILSSAAFLRSQRMSGLLQYLCGKYFSGESEQVKEYNIAVEVFGRPDTFDPVDDAIARVEVHRLRKKLREYYEREGASHEIRLVIPTGSYTPAFIPAEKSPPAPVPLADLPLPVPPRIEPPAAVPSVPRFSWFSTLLMAVIVVLIFVEITFHLRPRALAAGPESARGLFRTPDRDPAPVPDRDMANLPGREVRLACGQTQPFRDRLGRIWDADRFFTGGDGFKRPALLVGRTGDPGLFLEGRSGLFSYDVPLQPGNYDLHLFFAETEFGPGNPKKGGDSSRVFHVSANGQRILSDFDILSDAGGPNIADERVFKDVRPASDGHLHLRFIAHIGGAVVNAIELSPARHGRLNPVRIAVQDQPVEDSLGRFWEPDRYFSGGQVSLHGGSIEGARENRVYGNERFGNFTYAIPVAEDGSYDASLYFAETYWGPENPGGGGAGSRVFDIFCNGEALVRNFDVFKEVGASRALVERFRGLRANAQGKLLLSFVPVKNYASVYAIEVVDSSQ